MIVLKAILYLHVDPEITNPSIDLSIQEKDLRNHCLINDIEIIGVYKDLSTDYILNRTEFSYCYSIKGKSRNVNNDPSYNLGENSTQCV